MTKKGDKTGDKDTMTNKKGDKRRQKGDKPDTVTNTRPETKGDRRETSRTQ